MIKTAYCMNCDAETEYKVYPRTAIYKEDDLVFACRKRVCKCKMCGSEVYVDEICTGDIDSYKQAYAIARNRRGNANGNTD